MKLFYLLLLLIFQINISYSQFTTPKEFLEFANLTQPAKEWLLENNKWDGIGVNLYEKKINNELFVVYVDATNNKSDNGNFIDLTILSCPTLEALHGVINYYINNGFKIEEKVDENISFFINSSSTIRLKTEINRNDKTYILAVMYEFENVINYLNLASKEVNKLENDKSNSKEKTLSDIINSKKRN